MIFKFYFTDGTVSTLRANDDLMEDVINVYGYPHKVGIDKIEIHHGDGYHKTFTPE